MLKFLVIFLSFVSMANAASFDCSQATLEVEKLVCNNQAISELDEKLDASYRKLLLSVDKKTKSSIKDIQRNWLRARNKKNFDEFMLKYIYRNQINLLNYIQNNNDNKDISISDPNIKTIFLLLAEKTFSAPDTIQKIGNGLYLLRITNTGRVSQGYYGVNTNKKIMRKVLGGSPDIIHTSTDKSPVYVVRSISLSRGVYYESIGVIYKDNSDLGINSKWLLSLTQDGESGDCGRGPKIGVNKASKFIDYSFSQDKNGLLLNFLIHETDCITNKSGKVAYKYLFHDEGFEILK